MQDRQKMWRREASTDRQLMVALYHECRRAGMTPKAERAGHQFVVVAFANEWDLWRALNRARYTLKQKRAAAAIEAAKQVEARTKNDADYSNDDWANDERLSDDYGHYIDCSSMEYARAIFDEARSRNFESQWRRAEADSRKPWRVAVWEVSQSEFSEILKAASRSTLVAA